jgi:quercetin dioxygenase-like cupin family protein
VQEIRKRRGRRREETTDDDAIAWARELDARSSIVTPEIEDGEALFLDGKLWHGSHNRFAKTRSALLLQYATPDAPIRIPDYDYLDWPFRLLDSPRPGCLMLRGRAKSVVNRFFTAPAAAGDEASGSQLTSRVYPLRVPLAAAPDEAWKFHPIFLGPTPDMEKLSCHASALGPGHRAHPMHTHPEEELKLVLTGEIDLIFSDDPGASGDVRRRVKAGQVVYYPPEVPHTMEAMSDTPANYLTFRWVADRAENGECMPFGVFDVHEHVRVLEGSEGFRPHLLFEGRTAYLRKLHSHFSTLEPGAGYPPHVDAYAAAIVVLEGEVETLGQRVKPNGVVLFTPGEPHALRNPGKTLAKYVVFEFHASESLPETVHVHTGTAAVPGLKSRVSRLLRRLAGA